MRHPLMFRLECGVKSYEWGKLGTDSAAARFASTTNRHLKISQDTPYAELWMGTHPSSPCRDLSTGDSLAETLQKEPYLLWATVVKKFGAQLPFLFKVLSINKALSIQAHPNKTLAEQLHRRDPDHYPDDNHKPEMAIAITPFEGLCGFRPLPETAHFLKHVPSFRALVGQDTADDFATRVDGLMALKSADGGGGADALGVSHDNKEALKKVFGALMRSSHQDVETQVKSLMAQVEDEGDSFAAGGVPATSGKVLGELVRRLHGQYGADIGLFVLFFLNFVTLEPGEALFLVADDIHAYVSGDIIECMASSDNVVRAGLTPKFKDVDTLVDMLTYNFAPIEDQKIAPTEYPYATLNRAAYTSGSAIQLYDPPIEEFSIVRTVIRGGHEATALFEPLSGPSLIICTSGRGVISAGQHSDDVYPGSVFFVGATAQVMLKGLTDKDNPDFVTFRAFCELDDSQVDLEEEEK